LWRQRLSEAGLEILESIPIPGFDRFETRDPFGNRLEFIQPLFDPTKRFSSRVADYVLYRPDYPAGILTVLAEEIGFSREWVVADVGSGTGKLTKLFLEYGNQVYGVEPNDEMRLAGEDFLGGLENFRSVKGTAEATTLADSSVDLITAGQAFHWFDAPNARLEFQRILKPGGKVVFIWNHWTADLSPMMAEYHALLERYGMDVNRVRHSNSEAGTVLETFFAPASPMVQTLDNKQIFDFPGFKGRLFSSSYSPLPGHPNHEPMVNVLREIFGSYEQDGAVEFLYKTHVYYGSLE
jgi:SAM-dependent methyltransferase